MRGGQEADRRVLGAFIPPHLLQQLRPKWETLVFDCEGNGFRDACAFAKTGNLAVLQGRIRALNGHAARVDALKRLMQVPLTVATICADGMAMYLEGGPRLIGVSGIAYLDEAGGLEYLLPVADIADLFLRFRYATKGLRIYGMPQKLYVDSGVFIPHSFLLRALSNLVAELGTAGIDDFKGKTLCDAFCGSGVLGLWAVGLHPLTLDFVDRDPLAIECARKNYEAGCVNIRASFHRADALPFGTRFDTVLANPPFAEYLRHRPNDLQFCDPDLTLLTKLCRRVCYGINPGGALYLFHEARARDTLESELPGWEIDGRAIAGYPNLRLFVIRHPGDHAT